MDTPFGNEKRITVWGLKGVGKSSMVEILPKDLDMLARTSGLKFDIHKIDGENRTRARSPVQSQEPNSKFAYTQYEISIADSKKSGKTYLLSLFDDKGDAMEGALKEPEKDEFKLITQNIMGAHGVVAIVDPLNAILNKKSKYLIELLDEMIYKLDQRQEKTSLAICLNKADLIELRWKKPEVMFEMVFGPSWRSFQYMMKNVKNVNVKIFSVSTTGFGYNSRSESLPNYYMGKMIDVDVWQPWNVYAPFLWMFSQFESEGEPEGLIAKYFTPKGANYPKPLF